MSSKELSIAIIGMSGLFPLSKNIFEFWDNLKQGKDCITPIPPARLADLSSPIAQWGGFIEGIKEFDMDFFNIAPVEAVFMTPNERLFLQESWKCIESAGYTPDTLVDKTQGRVGVFVGVSFNDYGLYSNKKTPANTQTFSVANRVSYFCDFKGPSFTVDTACSSSMYALHLALQSMIEGECQVALAGGINLSLHSSKFEALNHFGFLASDGRCHAFGEGGNGYVPSEGVGVVLLKPLDEAIKDKDLILGVIRGSGVSQSGKGSGYHVPNPIAQTQAINLALEQSHIDPRTITYVEAHGTGTALGDPVEVAGLQDAYEPKTTDKQYCAIGSVKSGIGHLEGAAGISQLVKVLLQLQAKQIAPNLTHSKDLNPKIKFEQSPFYVVRELTPWNPFESQPRRAGISSFGAGGVNVHMIVDEYPIQETSIDTISTPLFIPLSAKTIPSLEAAITNLHQYLKDRQDNKDLLFSKIHLSDLAYTLQVGRVSMRYRLLLEVNSMEDLIQQLENVQRLKQQIQDKQKDLPDRASIAAALQAKDIRTLANAWVKGATIKWEVLYKEHPHQRIYLPTYTFSKDYCWPEAQESKPVTIIEPIAEQKPQSSILQSLMDVPENEKIALISSYLQTIIAQTLQYPESKLPNIEEGFFDLGISSIQTVALMNQIQTDFNIEVSQTAAFDYPSIKAYTPYLMDLLSQTTPNQALKKAQPIESSSSLDEDIAIISMACRFPGNSNTPEQFWELIKNGGDGIVDMPKERWDVSEYYDPDPEASGKMYVKTGGFISQKIDLFDAKLFGISATEAIDLDPQQRLLLELAWEVFENSNYNSQQISGSKTGVFIGMALPEYLLIPGDKRHYDLNQYSPYWATGSILSLASGRIAHTFGLHGPALTIDTACSSSLVSAHLACESIRRGECEQALAGGINLLLSPAAFVGLCRVRALAADGHCKTFDISGDGYGRSEGAGMVLLKKRSAAERDGDVILALIKGSAINQDGPSSGLTVPNGNAQKALIMEALDQAKLSPQDISYLEAHGTGTSLGDPIEMRSVTESLGLNRSIEEPLYLGAVKRNIGHTEAAAGIAGLIKSVLCLQHKKIPPLPVNQLNPKINLEKIPAIIPDRLIDWKPQRTALNLGISSFGFSGTNAHMILTEAPNYEMKHNEQDRTLHLMTLSAQTKEALESRVEDLKQFLATTTASLADIAFSANTGHNHLSHRLAFAAASIADLQEQLNTAISVDTHNTTAKVMFLFTQYEVQNQDYGKEFEDHYPKYHNIMRDLNPQEATLIQFCRQYALYKLLISWGVPIDGVYGESVGAYCAAVAAGIMDLESALALLLNTKTPEQIPLSPPKISFISSQTGEAVKSSEVIKPEYWLQQLNAPADTEKALINIQARGYNQLIQMNPGPALLKSEHYHLIQNEPSLIQTLTHLYKQGLSLDWKAFDSDYQRNKVILPNYPFQRKSYWIETEESPTFEKEAKPALQGVALPSFSNEHYFNFRISRHNLPELKDTHGVVHVGHFQEMLFNALKNIKSIDHYTLIDMSFLLPLMIDEDEIRTVSLILSQQEENIYQFKYLSQDQNMEKWSLHNQGIINLIEAMPSDLPIPVQKDQQTAKYTKDSFYSMMDNRGLHLGPSVQLIESVWQSNHNISAQLIIPNQDNKLHPGLFDACAQLFHVALTEADPPDLKIMVAKWGRFSFKPNQSFKSLYCDLLIKTEDEASKNSYTGDFTLYNELGQIIAQGLDCKMQGFTDETLQALRDAMKPQSNRTEQSPFLISLLNTPLEQRSGLIKELLTSILSQLLSISKEELPSNEALSNFGIDSIIAVSFHKEVSKKLGIDLGIEALMIGPTIEQLTAKMLPLLGQIKEDTPVLVPRSKEKALWYTGARKPEAKYRLFCLPYGGGGALIYRDWQALLSPEIDVIPLQLPGRENRVNEPAYHELQPLIEDLIEVIKSDLNLPFGIFGHSFGGFLAYNLANALIQQHQIVPKNVFVSAYSAPNIDNPRLMSIINHLKEAQKEELLEKTQLSDEDVQSILNLKIFPESSTMNETFIPIYIRVGFADIKVIKSFQYPAPPLACDLTVFNGSQDTVVSEKEMRDWVFLTTKDFKIYTIDGEHLFINETLARNRLLSIIENTLFS